MKHGIIGAGCAAAVLLCIAPAMAQQRVTVQIDESYDFSKVKTFSAQIATGWGNPIGEKNVLARIEQALVDRGWAKADPDRADAAVRIHGATEQKKQLNAMYSGGGWRYGGIGSGTITESEFTVGTLVVDIFDAGSKQLLFRGIASGQLSPKPEKNLKKLDKAAEKMFKDFPPAAPGAGRKK